MLRIISGTYKGRKILGHDMDGTRPTQDRVKMSMFGVIQDYIPDSYVLDLFAGTGNLGIEAISNGAKHVIFVDKSREAISTINKNLKNIPVSSYQVLEIDYKNALEKFKKENNKFSLVFLDPPYKDKIVDEILNILVEDNLLTEDALVVCELEHDDLKDTYGNLELWKEKTYGYKTVKIYRN